MTAPATEHGILGLASPWARAGIPVAERDAIAAAIPAGYQVGVSGHAHGGGRSFIVWGIGPDGPIAGLRWEHRHDPVHAARQMAERLQELVRRSAPRWVWCPTCADWIGATPPLLPPFWSLDKVAAMHIHPVQRVPLPDLVPVP